MSGPETRAEDIAQRRRWMGILARARVDELEDAFSGLAEPPAYAPLRAPETGLVMVRARAGGGGTRFNMGEMTVTRSSIRLDSGSVGHGYVAGRSHRHAELAAVFDALLQDADRNPELERQVLTPLAERQTEARAQRSRKAAATKVDFFTMVRGDD